MIGYPVAGCSNSFLGSQNELRTASSALSPVPARAMLTCAHFLPPLLSGPSNFLHLLATFPALNLGSVFLIPAVPFPLGTVSSWTDNW